MIKKILIGVGIVVVIAGATIGVLYFTKQKDEKTVEQTPAKTSVLDLSKDYGTCTMLSESSIKAALGQAANTLQPPMNMGIVADKWVGEGVDDLKSDSQICVYSFIDGGTIENGYNSQNAFKIQKTLFTNNSGPASLIKQIEQEPLNIAVEGVGERAFYNTNDAATGPNATYSFTLIVFNDKSSSEYSIHQPADKATFTSESAKSALITLAKQAKTN